MAERQIDVTFQSHYKGDLAAQLEKTKKDLADHQAWLRANPLELHFKVDFNGIKAQAAAAQEAILGVMKKGAGGASILGPDGRPMQGMIADLKQAQGLLQEINTTKFGDDGSQTKFLTQIEQIGDGLQRVSKFKQNAEGDFDILSSAEKDLRNVKALEDGLRAVNRELGKEAAAAAGRGDKAGQLAALRKQKAEVDKLVQDAAAGGLLGSSAFTKAENSQTSLGSKIAGLEGREYSAAEKKARADRSAEITKAIKLEEAHTAAKLKANKLEADQAERHLPDRAKYESEINRIYAERRKIFEDSKNAFQQMDKALLGENRPDLAQKAMNRGLNAGSQINQSDLDQSRALTDSMRRGAKELQDAKAKQLKDDVDRGQKSQKEYEAAMAKNLANDVAEGQKRIKEKAAADHAARESAFRQELQDIKAQSARRIAAITAAERRELAETKDASKKRHIAATANSLRQSEYLGSAGSYFAVEQRARAAGHVGLADTTRGKALAAGVAAEKDMARFEAATRKSGHALDFHTSSLLKNAVTYARWQIPMMGVQAIFTAFESGIQTAIRTDRQFATLQTVFHGTAEEAKQLKKETLDLAAAQGRSAEEAMDSSIRWSRLGLTRVQVLEATRVSLMAANVAEITAAEAAEKLSGIYATYRLNIGDLAGVLNRLNSISNNYNVTVDDLFQGISRVSGVAKSSGLALRDLEGIIGSVVGAGGGSGAEVGNALKTVLVRLGDPKTGANLKKAFDIDLTGPNGDLKDMSQIIRELADLYPTLNKAEQQRLLMLAAGSRQASRFSKVMSEYTQGQILAAEAGFDTTASLRENEKILGSLQNRIDAVKASWTQFATAIGDAGAFERGGQFMRYLQQIIMEYTASLDDAAKKSREIVIANPLQAETVERFGSGKNTLFGTRDSFSRQEIQDAIKKLQEGIDYQKGSNPLKYLDKYTDGSFDIQGKGFETKNFKSTEEAVKFVQELKDLLAEGGDDGFKNELSGISKEVNNLRENLGAMDKSSKVFDSLSKSFANGGADRQTLLRDWQAAAHLLLELEDGTNLYADSVSKFNSILASGDAGKMSEFLAGLGKLFSEQSKPKAEQLAASIAQAIPALDAKLVKLKADRDAIMAKPSDNSVAGRKEKQESLDDNMAKTKEVKSQIEQINQAVEIATDTAFGAAASAKINNYLDDVMAAAKAFGDAFKDFAPDADNDPVERIIARQRRALELGREMLGRIQEKTRAVSNEKREAAGVSINDLRDRILPSGQNADERKSLVNEIAAQQKIIDQQNEADVIIQSRIDAEDERLVQLQRELEYEEAIARVKRLQTDASKDAKMSSSAWRFGETDSDKDRNQAGFALGRARQSISAATSFFRTDPDSIPANARFRGSILQDEATARERLEAMEQRNYDIDAARRQIAYDTLKAMKEQTDEASKRFQMASREDQLRAAALARTLRDKGPVGQNEFAMLGQNSRQALVNYLPNEAPGNLNEAKSAAAKSRRELDEEQTRLKGGIIKVSTELESLATTISKLTGKGGTLDPLAGLAPVDPVQAPAATRDQNPVLNIDIGSVNLQLKLADGITGIVEAALMPRVVAELKAMETRLRVQKIPNPQGAVE